jgi:lambda repressor-like predicted transcriptional regulator
MPLKDPIYDAWSAMKKRCHDPRHRAYVWYGARGIRVCERWRKSFAAFAEDMGDRPEGTSLDRIDNDGHYEPGNCRWATRLEQQANLRSNRKLTAFGDTLHLQAWSRRTGIRPNTIRERLERGWAVEAALSTAPVDQRIGSAPICFNGRTQSLRAWARDLGINRSTLKNRIRRGWSIAQALQTP